MTRLVARAATLATILLLVAGSVRAVRFEGARTVRDRVYSADQAERGRSVYDAKCSECHDGGMGPSVKGNDFLLNWQDKTLRRLFDRIRTTMPPDAAGTLAESEVVDLVAFILRDNGFPAGDRKLVDSDELNDVTIVKLR